MIVSYVDLHATIQSTCRIVPPNADGTICYVDAVFHSILILDSAALLCFTAAIRKSARRLIAISFLFLLPQRSIYLGQVQQERELFGLTLSMTGNPGKKEKEEEEERRHRRRRRRRHFLRLILQWFGLSPLKRETISEPW